jgi:hypothetical protein
MKKNDLYTSNIFLKKKSEKLNGNLAFLISQKLMNGVYCIKLKVEGVKFR